MKTRYLITLLCLLALSSVVAAAQNTSTLDPAAAAAGKTDQAVQLYRAALQQEPNNVAALTALADILEAAGKWRDAQPLIEQLVQLQPQNSAALYKLGRMKSWQTGGRPEALELLRRACDTSNHDAEICDAYSDALSWGDNTRAEA